MMILAHFYRNSNVLILLNSALTNEDDAVKPAVVMDGVDAQGCQLAREMEKARYLNAGLREKNFAQEGILLCCYLL